MDGRRLRLWDEDDEDEDEDEADDADEGAPPPG